MKLDLTWDHLAAVPCKIHHSLNCCPAKQCLFKINLNPHPSGHLHQPKSKWIFPTAFFEDITHHMRVSSFGVWFWQSESFNTFDHTKLHG